MICNADESEPGTFKDRQILAEQPHLVIEGMLLGMLAVGAEQGWVFIRHEYGIEEEAVRAELDRARAAGLLGIDVLGSGRQLEIEVFTSPGGYILGEESALIECMEGHRGEPRNKPPFPGVSGLWGKPTLMNSVETFAAVPIIQQRGAQWWSDQGVNGGTGLKFFAVSGHIANPDVYCVPMGTTARELIELAGGMAGGATLQAFQPGGSSSNFLGPEELDVPLDFKPLADAGSMLGSGAVVVIDDQTDLLAAATNVLRFFRNESCGKCVPCRVGSHKAHTILTTALAEGLGPDGIDDAHRSPRGDVADDLDLRAGPGRARAGDERPAPRARRRAQLTGAMAATGREFFTAKTVAEALADFRPGHRTAVETVALDQAHGRVPAADILARRVPAGIRPLQRRRLRRPRPGHLRCVGLDPRLPGARRQRGHGRRRRARRSRPRRHRRPHRRRAPRRRRRRRHDRVHPGGDGGHDRGRAAGRAREGIVRADEDMAPGRVAVSAGAPLRPQDVAMLAAAGRSPSSRCMPGPPSASLPPATSSSRPTPTAAAPDRCATR